MSTNLANTRNTFGPSSPQHHAVLQLLRSCIKDAEVESQKQGPKTENARDDVDELRQLLERELNLTV